MLTGFAREDRAQRPVLQRLMRTLVIVEAGSGALEAGGATAQEQTFISGCANSPFSGHDRVPRPFRTRSAGNKDLA
jgi:hypothetical protein